MDSSALRRRYVAALKRADLRALRFHDLCHIFGSLAINYASIVPVLGVDGPRRRQYDDALPPPQEPRRRRGAALPRLPR